MANYAWQLAATQRFESSPWVPSTFAGEYNDAGTLTYDTGSPATYGYLSLTASGYNTGLRVVTSPEIQKAWELDVYVVSTGHGAGFEHIGLVAFAETTGIPSQFCVFPITTNGLTDFRFRDSNRYAPAFTPSPDLLTVSDYASGDIIGALHTLRVEIKYTNTAPIGVDRKFVFYFDGVEIGTAPLGARFKPASPTPLNLTKIYPGLYFRGISARLLEYREYSAVEVATSIDVQTLINGTPNVPTPAQVRLFSSAWVLLDTKTSGADGQVSFAVPTGTYYVVGKTLDDSLGMEASGPIVVV